MKISYELDLAMKILASAIGQLHQYLAYTYSLYQYNA